MLAAIAAVTSRIQIGSAVYHILGRTPATLALQAVGLEELSRGRFLLGIGVSNPTIARWHGLPFDHALGRAREYIEITRRAMQGEKVSFEGKYYSCNGFRMPFKPSGRKIPIYLAAFGPQMSRLAGTITDGVLINMANATEVRRIISAVRQGAHESGKDPASLEFIVKVRCSVASDRATAREALSRVLTFYSLADYYRDLLSRMGFAEEVNAMRAAWQASGFHAARALISDRLFSSVPMVAANAVEEVQESLQPYIDAGATRILLPYVPNSEDVVGETRRFVTAWRIP
jgi:alkanesulfonate monooxygenase SsuD/methylene tetrahydromethanopterin reductase-like flavin-dependent oxidoreductase (luciferase family)